MPVLTREGPHVTPHQQLSYDASVAPATADPAVVGLVLKGSRAHDGMTTRRSDHDLYVVLADGAATGLTRFAGHRGAGLDPVVLTLGAFRAGRGGGTGGRARHGAGRVGRGSRPHAAGWTVILAPGLNFSSSAASSAAASSTSDTGTGGRLSSRKKPEVVPSVSLVRGP